MRSPVPPTQRPSADLVGRADDLLIIREFVADAGGTLLLYGEPGVGKTALLETAAQVAQAAGTLVLRAAGADQLVLTDHAGPYQYVRLGPAVTHAFWG